jgi:hypothetical protein
MGFSEALIGGLRLLNRNWQLVLIQLVLVVVNCISLVFIVILPLFVIVLALGLNPSMLQQIHSPQDLFSLAPGIILSSAALFLIYITFVTFLALYVFCSSAGVLSKSAIDIESRFSLREFFSEGKRLFFPFLSYSALIGLIAIFVVFIFALLLFLLPVTSLALKGMGNLTSSIVSSLLALVLFFLFMIILLGIMSVMLYGMARIIFRGRGAFATLKDVVNYLLRNPQAFAVFVIASLIYLIVNLLVFLIGTPLHITPGTGSLLSIPFQILYYAFQSYSGLWILSVILLYYYKTEIEQPEVLDTEGTVINEE